MTPHHHLDEATVLRYASGDLDEAFSVVVACHVAMCPACRRAVRLAEEVGGALLEEAEEAALAPQALERVLARLDAPPPLPLARPEREEGDVPLPLRRYIGPRLDAVPWKTVAPGIRRHRIRTAGGTPSPLYMLHIGPGKAVPEHGHGGAEMTLILSGAYQDALGRFGPGDIADLDEHIEHQPRVEGGAPCICLVSTERPTRFKGFFSRLLQPLVGI
ncbi:transcriptional regulator [Paroceanicella profunda]|uniref:Transcriptional regulator n=1 Tax=Paroceanicella profunda TaxID=2579971 RepID=A0A5B8FTH9_9RHOB|nr:ChrR family anti-sigma-E factor [Paroceanicella profunda]QDL91665.1 transcriptional regulator [Paroceanicella profunda]